MLCIFFDGQHPVDGHRFFSALDRDVSQWLEIEKFLCQAIRIFGNISGSRFGQRFHPRSHVDRVSYERQLHAEFCPEETDDNHSRVDANSHPYG